MLFDFNLVYLKISHKLIILMRTSTIALLLCIAALASGQQPPNWYQATVPQANSPAGSPAQQKTLFVPIPTDFIDLLNHFAKTQSDLIPTAKQADFRKIERAVTQVFVGLSYLHLFPFDYFSLAKKELIEGLAKLLNNLKTNLSWYYLFLEKTTAQNGQVPAEFETLRLAIANMSNVVNFFMQSVLQANKDSIANDEVLIAELAKNNGGLTKFGISNK